MTTKNWTLEEIRKLLKESDKAVARAILAIYNLQTENEQVIKETTEHNGVGYNGVDANFMSSLAQFYQAKGFLSAGQLKHGRKVIMKYAAQLTDIANREWHYRNTTATEADQYPAIVGIYQL